MNVTEETDSTLDPTVSEQISFEWVDYLFFFLLPVASVAIGLYFGFFSKQDSTSEYLLGGRRMTSLPIAASMIASHISGITLLGVPAEVYRYGSQYAACVFTSILTALVTAHVFLPVFYELELTSTFEYLEHRFARPVRTLCSLLFVLSSFAYVPIVVYVPALAFSQVTDFGVHTVTPILCAICILYTTIGGLKAVVWTDALQFSVTIGALFAVLILGIRSVGGAERVWRISEEGGRLVFFDMDPSPFARNSFWGMTVGMTITWIGHLGIHPGIVQRFLSVPTKKDATRAVAITAVGMIIVKLVSVFTGLIMFAKYHDCDPLSTKSVKRSDQIVPYYVMDVARNVSGLPGLFLAGLVSAALATMSATLNTMAGIVYEDFIQPFVPEGPRKEARAANIMKSIVLIGGIVSIGLVFAVERLGSVFQSALSVRGITDGPCLGLFVLGTLVPRANARGAMLGGCAGLLVMFCLVVGTEWHAALGWIRHAALPASVAGCPYPFNETETFDDSFDFTAEPPAFFKISFVYYTAIGCSIVVLVGTVESCLFGRKRAKTVGPIYFAPMVRRFVPRPNYGQVSTNETAAENAGKMTVTMELYEGAKLVQQEEWKKSGEEEKEATLPSFGRNNAVETG